MSEITADIQATAHALTMQIVNETETDEVDEASFKVVERTIYAAILAERERCAKIADKYAAEYMSLYQQEFSQDLSGGAGAAGEIADAIRREA